MNGRGDDVLDKIGVTVLDEVTSEGVEINVSVCTGLDEPDDEGLPMLPSETESRSSSAPSVADNVLFIGGEGLPVPNCSN